MSHGQPSQKVYFILLIVYLFKPDIKMAILWNYIAKWKTKRLWLRDMNFISKISGLRSQKLAFYSVFLLINQHRNIFQSNCNELSKCNL